MLALTRDEPEDDAALNERGDFIVLFGGRKSAQQQDPHRARILVRRPRSGDGPVAHADVDGGHAGRLGQAFLRKRHHTQRARMLVDDRHRALEQMYG